MLGLSTDRQSRVVIGVVLSRADGDHRRTDQFLGTDHRCLESYTAKVEADRSSFRSQGINFGIRQGAIPAVPGAGVEVPLGAGFLAFLGMEELGLQSYGTEDGP